MHRTRGIRRVRGDFRTTGRPSQHLQSGTRPAHVKRNDVGSRKSDRGDSGNSGRVRKVRGRSIPRAAQRSRQRKGERVIGAMTRHEIQVLREAGVPGARVARQAEVSERSVWRIAKEAPVGDDTAPVRGDEASRGPAIDGGTVGDRHHRVAGRGAAPARPGDPAAGAGAGVRRREECRLRADPTAAPGRGRPAGPLRRRAGGVQPTRLRPSRRPLPGGRRRAHSLLREPAEVEPRGACDPGA